MEKITKTTHYWLFKKVDDNLQYYYVRVKTDGIENVTWVKGYVNHLNLVSTVGPALPKDLTDSLEKEFQNVPVEN